MEKNHEIQIVTEKDIHFYQQYYEETKKSKIGSFLFWNGLFHWLPSALFMIRFLVRFKTLRVSCLKLKLVCNRLFHLEKAVTNHLAQKPFQQLSHMFILCVSQ